MLERNRKLRDVCIVLLTITIGIIIVLPILEVIKSEKNEKQNSV